MKMISLDALHAIVKSYVDENMIANTTFTATKEDLTGLLNKIAKEVTIDGDYSEGLDFMSGYDITLGNTIEEYFANFIAPEDYDETGADCKAPSRLTWQKPTYSSRLGRKKFKTTRDFGTIQKAFKDASDYEQLVSFITKRLYDSLEIYLNDVRRQALGFAANKALSVANDTIYNQGSAYVAGDRVKNGVIIDSITSPEAMSWDTALYQGKAVALDLSTELAIPTDVETGEAFIKSVKTYAKAFKKPHQGYSYNGNIAGAAPSYTLFVKEGILPSIEVDTLAGAFNKDMLEFGVRVVEVKNLGDSEAYALLIDDRGIKVHNNYRAVRDDPNGEGDFVNYVLHDEETIFYSPNVMTHAWKAPTTA